MIFTPPTIHAAAKIRILMTWGPPGPEIRITLNPGSFACSLGNHTLVGGGGGVLIVPFFLDVWLPPNDRMAFSSYTLARLPNVFPVIPLSSLWVEGDRPNAPPLAPQDLSLLIPLQGYPAPPGTPVFEFWVKCLVYKISSGQ